MKNSWIAAWSPDRHILVEHGNNKYAISNQPMSHAGCEDAEDSVCCGVVHSLRLHGDLL